MPAEITIPYTRVPGYPREHVGYSNTGVTDKVQCEYSDRITLSKELLGYSVTQVFITPGVSTLFRPQQYDAGDEPLNGLYVTSVDIEPLLAPARDGSASYLKALLTIHYTVPDYDVTLPEEEGTTVYVTESLEPAAEFLTLTNRKLYWDTGASADDELDETEMPSKIIRMIDWVYTIHKAESLPEVFFTLPGKVNDASVYSRALDRTFEAETLLCGNPSMSREVTNEGVTAWTITFRFTYRNNGTAAAPRGWNYFPRMKDDTAADITWSRIYDASDHPKDIYETANFAGLID